MKQNIGEVIMNKYRQCRLLAGRVMLAYTLILNQEGGENFSVAESKIVGQKIFDIALRDLKDSPILRRTPYRHNGYEKQAEDGLGRRKGSGLQEIALEEEGEGCEKRKS
jgi:hypothetical protein